jgi:hypothetical protein
MTQLLLDSSAYIAFKKRHPEVVDTLPQAEKMGKPDCLSELRTDSRF